MFVLAAGAEQAHAVAYTFQTIDSPRAIPLPGQPQGKYPNTYATDLFGINDLGAIVGADHTNIGNVFTNEAFVDSAGSFAFTGPTPLYSINNNSQAVGGYAFDQGGIQKLTNVLANVNITNDYFDGIPLFNNENNVTVVNVPLGNTIVNGFDPIYLGYQLFNQATGINDLDQIVGVGFLYTDSTGTVDAFNLPDYNGQKANPVGINNAGQITGEYGFNPHGFTGVGDGFLDTGGVVTVLSVPGEATGSTSPQGISNSGEVVGNYLAPGAASYSNFHGFAYDNGTYTTIDVPGAISTFAEGVNVEGDIVGYYTDSTGEHGFLATPVPEPASITLLGLGLGGLGLIIRRRRGNV